MARHRLQPARPAAGQAARRPGHARRQVRGGRPGSPHRINRLAQPPVRDGQEHSPTCPAVGEAGKATRSRPSRSLGLARCVGADHMATGSRMVTHTYASGPDLCVNLVGRRYAVHRYIPPGPMRQSLWSIAPDLCVNLCDAFLIPVRVVRRATRTKASAPCKRLSLGEYRLPQTPRPSAQKPRYGAAKDLGGKRSFCGFCKMIKGSGGIIPPAAGGGPQTSGDEEKRNGPGPTCGATGAGLNPLRTGTRLRRNPAQPERAPGPRARNISDPAQAATKAGTVGAASPAEAAGCRNVRMIRVFRDDDRLVLARTRGELR